MKIINSNAFALLVLAVMLGSLHSCTKEATPAMQPVAEKPEEAVAATQGENVKANMRIANIRDLDNGSAQIAFIENAQLFTITNTELISDLKAFYTAKTSVEVTYNPWTAQITKVSAAKNHPGLNELNSNAGIPIKIDHAFDAALLDNSERIGVLNTTTALTNVIPDMATAQLMFNYITTQCCAVPGPYSIDYCIPFQYAYDGCYARAHKMCYILNNKYHYDTHKIFSFANAGSDVLSVQAQKWGGCCVNWWYHVAPLVNIKTPAGVKAYVFDPAMFNQPVLLSVWLHAQEHPACGWGANVSMINIQPTASYAPADYSGYMFGTDPFYYDTDYTLVNYSNLSTCL